MREAALDFVQFFYTPSPPPPVTDSFLGLDYVLAFPEPSRAPGSPGARRNETLLTEFPAKVSVAMVGRSLSWAAAPILSGSFSSPFCTCAWSASRSWRAAPSTTPACRARRPRARRYAPQTRPTPDSCRPPPPHGLAPRLFRSRDSHRTSPPSRCAPRLLDVLRGVLRFRLCKPYR